MKHSRASASSASFLTSRLSCPHRLSPRHRRRLAGGAIGGCSSAKPKESRRNEDSGSKSDDSGRVHECRACKVLRMSCSVGRQCRGMSEKDADSVAGRAVCKEQKGNSGDDSEHRNCSRATRTTKGEAVCSVEKSFRLAPCCSRSSALLSSSAQEALQSKGLLGLLCVFGCGGGEGGGRGRCRSLLQLLTQLVGALAQALRDNADELGHEAILLTLSTVKEDALVAQQARQ
jgi:hypothetical protein